MEDLINKLILLVQQTAPYLWEIARRQVLAVNIQDGIFLVISIVGIVFFLKVLPKIKDDDDCYEKDKIDGFIYWSNEGYCLAQFGGWASFGLFVIIATCNITSIVMRIVNPDYYALKVLLGLIQ